MTLLLESDGFDFEFRQHISACRAGAGKPRVRGFDAQYLRISNLHSGRSGVGNDVYPGDKSIKFEDSICIQIHRIKLDCDSVQWGGKELYTLAIYYPDQLAINYVNATQG